jgi:hypothetical protein
VAEVISLSEERDRRRGGAGTGRAVTHPALRWVAGDAYYVAHRRALDEAVAVCGADGALILAPPGVPLCPACYRDGTTT